VRPRREDSGVPGEAGRRDVRRGGPEALRTDGGPGGSGLQRCRRPDRGGGPHRPRDLAQGSASPLTRQIKEVDLSDSIRQIDFFDLSDQRAIGMLQTRTNSLLSVRWVDDGIWARVWPSGPMNQAPLAQPLLPSAPAGGLSSGLVTPAWLWSAACTFIWAIHPSEP